MPDLRSGGSGTFSLTGDQETAITCLSKPLRTLQMTNSLHPSPCKSCLFYGSCQNHYSTPDCDGNLAIEEQLNFHDWLNEISQDGFTPHNIFIGERISLAREYMKTVRI